ncbi:helix-turn-helix domain-containing protein [uncultured Psychroserpens sp.]|uniref:helix-turn-helix domain-containing protein n=1 Tax=uncultured Psychroserpens sp. TaxID=255436 RepID=UPI002608128B|nr:helix-turn-helix domain-containing protein [uncultured Psychroserpens sp.]
MLKDLYSNGLSRVPMKRTSVFLLFLLSFNSVLRAQNHDSLKNVDQAGLFKIVNRIYNYGLEKKFDSARHFSKKAMLFAKASNDSSLIAYVAIANARVQFWKADINKAKEQLTYYADRTVVSDTTKVLAQLYLGEVYSYEDDYVLALKHFTKAEKIAINLPNWKKRDTRIFSCYASMGKLNQLLKNYEYAENYFSKALKLTPNSKMKSALLFDMSSLYEKKEDFNKAIEHALGALGEAEMNNWKLMLPTYYTGLSRYYLKKNHADSAIYFAKKGLKYNEYCRLDQLNNNIGEAYVIQGNYEKASEYFRTALTYSSTPKQTLEVYKNLRELNRQTKKYKLALHYNDLLLKLKDSLSDLKVKQEIVEITEQFESDKKQVKIDNLNEKNDLNKVLIKKQKHQIILAVLLLVLLTSLASLIIHFYKKQNKKKQQLFLKNQQLVRRIENLEIQHKKKNNAPPSEIADKSRIQQFIYEFIENKDYLSKEITLQKMAKDGETNTTYLSKIINEEYGKSFSNFINDLRITFTLKKLEISPYYRKLTIEDIAEKSGFTSANSFYRAFKKKTGVTPSYYIKRILNKN